MYMLQDGMLVQSVKKWNDKKKNYPNHTGLSGVRYVNIMYLTPNYALCIIGLYISMH